MIPAPWLTAQPGHQWEYQTVGYVCQVCHVNIHPELPPPPKIPPCLKTHRLAYPIEKASRMEEETPNRRAVCGFTSRWRDPRPRWYLDARDKSLIVRDQNVYDSRRTTIQITCPDCLHPGRMDQDQS